MSNIIDKIQLSGITYDIGVSGVSVVEVTQAEYDALPSSAKTDTSKMYVITDAEAGDLTNYYTKSETNTLLGGKADTATTYTKTEVDNAITAATSTKQDTLVSGTNIKTINNISILGSGNIDIQGGGGGKAIEAGRGISVTTGETADTVSFNLPISAGTGVNSITEGDRTTASGDYSHTEGGYSTANGNYSHAEGMATITYGMSSHAEGYATEARNKYEHASGAYNVSNTGSTDADKTLFSVGNGTSSSAKHNAFEIRQNGDIYLTKDGQDVKLQDQLGGGGGGGSVNVVQTTGTSTTDVMSQDAVTTQLGGYVTTDTDQVVTSRKIFTNSDKAIEFKQVDDNSKVGFRVKNSASTKNELASFEFRPNTFTIDGVQHPLMYFGHYRNSNTGNAGVPQTVIGFRQYDQLNAAAYHYLMPLPEKAKTPFNLTTSFKDYYAPIGFKNGSTMITADDTGVVDLSSELGGKVDTNTYTAYTAATDAALATKQTTLTAGTNITIVDNVISATGGGSITVDQTIDRTSENPISNKAISNKATDGNGDVFNTSGRYKWVFYSVGGVGTNQGFWLDKINGEPVIRKYSGTRDLSLVETSAITTSVSSSSTDAQVPSAKAVNDKLGGLSLVKLTQAQYDALATKDSNTLYVING